MLFHFCAKSQNSSTAEAGFRIGGWSNFTFYLPEYEKKKPNEIKTVSFKEYFVAKTKGKIYNCGN